MSLFCKAWNDAIKKNHEHVYEVIEDDFVSSIMVRAYSLPIGTKYKQFCMLDELEEGMKVCITGRQVGTVTKVINKNYCTIDGEQKYTSQIQYIIIN